jgi:nucleoside-diphosphate-sugar epimerase
VTGCAGFSGSHLAESLPEDGFHVTGVDCFNANYGRREKLRNLERARDRDDLEFVRIDLSRGDLTDLVADCDVVFYLAAEPGVRESWEAVSSRTCATTSWPRSPCWTRYGPGPISASSTRLPNRSTAMPSGFQPLRTSFPNPSRPMERPSWRQSTETRDFTFVSDVVAAARAARFMPDLGGEMLNVDGDAQISVSQALAFISEVAGRALDLPYGHRRHGDVAHTGADTPKRGRSWGSRRLSGSKRRYAPSQLDPQHRRQVASAAAPLALPAMPAKEHLQGK